MMRTNRYRHPQRHALAPGIDRLANSPGLARVRRFILSRLPFLRLGSEVSNVVYATWLVDARRARAFVPEGATLWARDGLTPFTILTYQHAHFGPLCLGALRRWFPSPRQSNWRLYLEAPLPQAPPRNTVVFVRNILDGLLHALGSRLSSDVLPSHLARVDLAVGASAVRIDIAPGEGSAPALSASFSRHQQKRLPEAFAPFGTSWEQLAETLCAQEVAVTPLADGSGVAVSEIELPVDPSTLEPLTLGATGFQCPFLSELGVQSEPLCFLLPKVPFRVLSEKVLHG